MREQYGMTVNGMEFFRKARFEIRPYHSREIAKVEQDEIERKTKENELKNSTSELWVKKLWLLAILIAWALGFFGDLGKEYFKQKILSEKNKASKDSIQVFRK